MGWWYPHHTRSARELIAYIMQELHQPEKGRRVLARAVRAFGHRMWTVLQNPDGQKYIVLFLMHQDSEGTWGYKDIEESCGPVELDCPLKYLDMVDPPSNQWATDWRAAVRQHHATQKAKTEHLKGLRVGDQVHLREGCKPNGPFRILSTKPLKGSFNGIVYKLPRKHIATVVSPTPVRSVP